VAPTVHQLDRLPDLRSNRDCDWRAKYPADLYRTTGSGENWVLVVPSLDLLLTFNGRTPASKREEIDRTSLERLFAAVNPSSTQKVLKSSTPVAFGSTYTAAAMIAGQRDFGGGRCQQDRNYGGAYHHGFWLNKKSDGSLRFSNARANLFHTSGHRCSKRSIFVWPDLNLVIAFNNSRMDGFADSESARSQLIDKVNAAVLYDDP
jgi:hypothetical protein